MTSRSSNFRFDQISRRQVLAGAAAAGAEALSAGLPSVARAATPPTLVTSIRSLSNPYHAVWKIGADAFAKSVGMPNVTLVTEANSEKGISDIRAMIAKTGGNMVLNVDPNNTPDARPIVEACVNAKVYVVSWWNKPADLHPWDFNPYYISHIEFDGVTNGGYIADELFKAMGDQGGFVAVGGMISDSAAIDRRKGMMEALKKHPKIELLDFQTGDWQSQKAFDITSSWLTRFGDKIKGVWAANDDMGTGGAARPRVGRQDSGGRHRRHQSGSRSGEGGRIRLHRHLRSLLAGRHRPVDGAAGSARQIRSRQGAEAASRVQRENGEDHPRKRRRLHQDQR